MTLANSTVSDNFTAGSNAPGGGIFTSSSRVTIHNSIVASNSSASGNADLFLSSTLTVRHSLIGDNSGTGLTEAPVGSPDVNGNLIGGATNGVIDPLLGPLANNGGSTMTHALLAGSPAIDAGSDALAMDPGPDHTVGGGDDIPLTTDQRGAPFVRTFDVAAVPDGVAGFTDMGALEANDIRTVISLDDYSTYLGGVGIDDGLSVTHDGVKFAYVAGVTSSAGLATANAYDPTHNGGQDAFVAKYDIATGNLVYFTYLGGSENDMAVDIAVGANGIVYLTGSTKSANFPTQNPFQPSFGGGVDGFVLKLDTNAGSSGLAYAS